jgi:hypothetical protein
MKIHIHFFDKDKREKRGGRIKKSNGTQQLLCRLHAQLNEKNTKSCASAT